MNRPASAGPAPAPTAPPTAPSSAASAVATLQRFPDVWAGLWAGPGCSTSRQPPCRCRHGCRHSSPACVAAGEHAEQQQVELVEHQPAGPRQQVRQRQRRRHGEQPQPRPARRHHAPAGESQCRSDRRQRMAPGQRSAARRGDEGDRRPRRRNERRRQRPGDRSDQHFDAGGMAEEGLRAGAGAVGARLEHDDQVADLRPPAAPCGRPAGRAACTAGRPPTPISRARRSHAVADRHRIVLAHHLAEVARRRQVVVAGRRR